MQRILGRDECRETVGQPDTDPPDGGHMGEQIPWQDSDLLAHIEDDLRTGAAAWREPDLDVQEALKEYNAIYQRYEPGERPHEAQHRIMELEQLLASRGYLTRRIALHTFELTPIRRTEEPSFDGDDECGEYC